MGAAAGRNFGLDLLRAVAILIVLANHALLGFWNRHGGVPIVGWTAHASTTAIVSIEWLFVLSGLLIGNMMVRSFEREPTFWQRARGFWLRRWFRTVPLYYVFVVVNLGLVWWGLTPARFSWDYVVFSQNLLGPERAEPFFPEAWSLALDEWFYLTMPLLVGLFAWIGRRMGWGLRGSFLLGTAVLIVLPMLVRATIVPTDYMDWDARVRRVTITHLDATGWGVLAAVVSRWHPGPWARAAAPRAILGLACTVLGIWLLTGHYTAGPDRWLVDHLPRVVNVVSLGLLSFGAFLALPWIIARPAQRLAQRPVAFLSEYSYAIYLSHVPLLLVLAHWLPSAPSSGTLAWVTAAWLCAVVAVSVAIHHAFEKPVSDLRERFTRKVDANPFQAAPQPPAPRPPSPPGPPAQP